MEDFELRTRNLLQKRVVPVADAVENNDPAYFNWLLQKGLRVPNTILIDILQNGWPDQYVMPLIRRHGAAYFVNPMEAAVYAEKSDLISEMIKAGVPVTREAILKTIEEDREDLLLLLLPDYKGDLEGLLDIAKTKGAAETERTLKEMGFTTTIEKLGDKCEKDENGNIVDPVTFDVVPSELIVAVPVGTKDVQCFSLVTLYDNWKASGKYTNPYNRQPLPDAIVARIKEYEQKNKIQVVVRVSGRQEFVIVDRNAEIGQVLLLFNENTEEGRFRGRQNLDKFYLLVPVGGGKKRIYEYDLLTTLDSLGIDGKIPFEAVGITTSASGNVLLEELYTRLYTYLYKKGYPWADNHIPDIYLEPLPPVEGNVEDIIPGAFSRPLRPPPQQDAPGVNDAQEMMTVIALQKTPQALQNHIRQKSPKIRSYQANFISEQIQKGGYAEESARQLQHLVYSRVVDKQNLSPYGIGSYYILNLYQQPNYSVKM